MKSNENRSDTVSDLLGIALSIYRDACAKCPADVSDLRDLDTLRSRVKDEGLSFLTITLPSFARSLEEALARGWIGSDSFPGFRKRGPTPCFLQGMVSLIFDRENGRKYDENHPYASLESIIVDSVRQLCLAFKRIELDCTPKRIQKALDNYIEVERSFEMFTLPDEERLAFRNCSFVLWSRMLRTLRANMFLPRHGPGATAERIHGNRKYAWRSWYDRLEPFFPLFGTAYTMGAIDSEELDELTIVNEHDELPVRVIHVPKTLKGPRIIAIEPMCMQYAQHGIQGILYDAIESYWLTAGHINFRDQSVNQSLAMSSSIDGQLATIDLSDASDRVPLSLALDMFDSNSEIKEAIVSCRSTHATMPDGRIIGPLVKFASMGSALCFPVEAMYFYTICVKALLDSRNLPYTFRNCYIVSRDIYVYGDDILVPQSEAGPVLDYLQKYNCKINTSKSFWTGKFRESCGVDAYAGEQVTPVYLNHDIPKNRQQASELISWVETSNFFYKKGYWNTAQLMRKIIDKILGPLPYVSEESPALGYISFLGYRSASRWNAKLQRLEILAWTPGPVYRTDKLEGWAALSKSLSRLSDGKRDDSEDSALSITESPKGPVFRRNPHLLRSALHGAVTLKRRWVSAS